MEQPFHIWFERSGGFTGIPTQVEVDSQFLSKEEAAKLWQMIEEGDFFEMAPADSPGEKQADQFQYKITIEHEGNKHAVTLQETSVPERLRPLINYLTQKARSQK